MKPKPAEALTDAHSPNTPVKVIARRHLVTLA